MSPAAMPRRRPGIVARTIAGETLLVPVRHRAQEMGLFTLNPVGTFVWERLDGRPLAQLVQEIVAAFDVGAEEAARDLARFLDELAAADCIEEAAP